MAQKSKKEEITLTHILVPMGLMAVTMALLFAFQMTQIMRDRDALNQTLTQQEEPFKEAQKLNAQFGGLVVGTRKLADEGSKGAKAIVAQLKKIGLIPEEAPQAASPAPVPAAMEKAPPPGSPVKP